MTTLLDYKTTLAYLAYLGYDGDRASAISVTRYGSYHKMLPKIIFVLAVVKLIERSKKLPEMYFKVTFLGRPEWAR